MIDAPNASGRPTPETASVSFSDSAGAPGGESAGVPPARILVVDDQPANIQIVGGMLGKLGHEIVPAGDGETAFRRISARRPDLILLDLILPGLDGCEVCRRLKDNPEWKDIPVIFLSASDDKDLIVRALNSGGVDYLTKPFHLAELVSRVGTHLALKAARDRLARLAEDKDELIGILAHDLKSHLGGIEMSAGLLADRIRRSESADDKAVRLAENIAISGGNLLRFVKEYLANAVADRGISLQPARVNLAAAADAAVEQYRVAAERKRLILERRDPDGDATVFADPQAVSQVLDNLVSNAVKFSPADRRIVVDIGVAAETDGVEIRVRDQGPGFSSADRERMFRRYARLSARPTGSEPSTGLGLSIVNRLVQAMNGRLDLEDTPGGGATFIVRLPRPRSTD
ncbi:MAG: response regulator [Limisphaerales bacterium]